MQGFPVRGVCCTAAQLDGKPKNLPVAKFYFAGGKPKNLPVAKFYFAGGKPKNLPMAKFYFAGGKLKICRWLNFILPLIL